MGVRVLVVIKETCLRRGKPQRGKRDTTETHLRRVNHRGESEDTEESAHHTTVTAKEQAWQVVQVHRTEQCSIPTIIV